MFIKQNGPITNIMACWKNLPQQAYRHLKKHITNTKTCGKICPNIHKPVWNKYVSIGTNVMDKYI